MENTADIRVKPIFENGLPDYTNGRTIILRYNCGHIYLCGEVHFQKLVSRENLVEH